MTFIALLILLPIFVIFFLQHIPSEPPAVTKAFITANPIILSQVKAISQYRSCEGHNYSGKNAQGDEETYRTLKHYIEVTDKFVGSTGRVKIFAPFDGHISRVTSDSRGSQLYLSPANSHWNFIFFHVDLLPMFKDGSRISSGEHIGYANLTNGSNYDIAMRWFGYGSQRNDSPFPYMTSAVLAEYATAGISLDNIIIPKEVRDANPCKLSTGQSGRDAFYHQSESGKNWITIEH